VVTKTQHQPAQAVWREAVLSSCRQLVDLWCSDAVAPQKHDTMASLKLDVSQGIAARIARACTHTLAFTQPASSLLVQDPPQAGGLLAGVAGGLAGSTGELENR